MTYSLFTAGTLTGFDASGHIAEETKNARYAVPSTFPTASSDFQYSVVAGKGILTSAAATSVLGFATAILFLFCTPDLDTFFALNAPQPFVQIYALALGKGPSIFMTIIAVVGLILVSPSPPFFRYNNSLRYHFQNTSVAIVAASRLVFAVARDGVLPFSGWIGKVDANGQPKNAVTVIFVFGAAILCTILPSQVAFTSLVSAGGIPTIAAYGLIALLRLTMTPDEFQSSHFRLGGFAKPFYLCAGLFNALIFAVRHFPLLSRLLSHSCFFPFLQVMISPFYFPVASDSFNFVSSPPSYCMNQII